jgi:hypothetical protein
MRTFVAVLGVAASAFAHSPVGAQIIGVQVIHVPGGDGRAFSLGAQGEMGIIVSTRYLDVWPSLAIEYQRQSGLGPGRGRVAAELRLLPGFGERSFHPYAGVGVSANQSGGQQTEWSGTLIGFQGIAGVTMVPSERVPVGLLLEERLGYVKGQEHATATHLGLLIRFR